MAALAIQAAVKTELSYRNDIGNKNKDNTKISLASSNSLLENSRFNLKRTRKNIVQNKTFIILRRSTRELPRRRPVFGAKLKLGDKKMFIFFSFYNFREYLMPSPAKKVA